MTDNEIIKAKGLIEKLKEAYDFYYDVSRSMPYDIDVTLRETAICFQNCLDEINHLKAEIERLEKGSLNRSGPVKEFAERLKEKLHLNGAVMGSNCAIVNDVEIDNLVKEMVGEG